MGCLVRFNFMGFKEVQQMISLGAFVGIFFGLCFIADFILRNFNSWYETLLVHLDRETMRAIKEADEDNLIKYTDDIWKD